LFGNPGFQTTALKMSGRKVTDFVDGNYLKKGVRMGNIIVMTWLLSLGLVPNSLLETNGGSIDASNCLIQTLGVDFYLVNRIHIYSTVEIQETKTHGVYFDPFRGDFLLGGDIRFGNLSIGFLHECNHDIVTYMDFHDYSGWEAAFDKAYINYAMPFRVAPGISVTPSITLADQLSETIRIKSNDPKKYFDYIKLDVSPNVLFPEFGLEIEFFCLRSHVAFQAGYATHTGTLAHTQLDLGAELFYKNISLGFDYIKRKNTQKNAGYSLEGLTLFVRFRGRSSLL
jgi:hypothetical protein